jgi:hypothetical protein
LIIIDNVTGKTIEPELEKSIVIEEGLIVASMVLSEYAARSR